jgi:localization factor PodJL
VSSISPKGTAGSVNSSVPEGLDQTSKDGHGATPVGSWQQAAGIFSAIANMLSSDLTTHETNRQNRADLIQRLDELETTLRNGGSDDNDSLKTALARLETELRAWHGMTRESELNREDKAGVHDAEPGEGAGLAVEAPARDTSASVKTKRNSESAGSREQFGHHAHDVHDSLARHGSAKVRLPLIERWGAANRVTETFPAPIIDYGHFDALAKRIETSHRELAARLEEGLATATSETITLKDLIANTAKKIEFAREADQSQQADAALGREIANLAGRLDRAGEGFASLTSLEHAIAGLSIQLENACRKTSSLTITTGAEPLAGLMKPAIEYGDDTKTVLRDIADMRALHENTWQRVHLALTKIQESIEQIAKATLSGAGLNGAPLVPSSLDPFAPILTSLAQHNQDGPLAARGIRTGTNDPGARDKEILLAADRLQAAGKRQPGAAANGDTLVGGSEEGAAGFLIEPGRGFPGQDEEWEPHGQTNAPPKATYDRQGGTSRTDFIAAARRAARTAQKELRGAETKSAIGNNGMVETGSLPLRRPGRDLLVHYKRLLLVGGVLLFVSISAYVSARTLTHNRLGDFVSEFLKQFDGGAIRANPAARGEASVNKSLASQSLPRYAPRAQSQASPSPGRQMQAGESLGGQVPIKGTAAMAAIPLDPIAPAESGFAANGAVRTGDLMSAGNSSLATRVIAGSDAIVAGTLGRNNATSDSARSRPIAASVPMKASSDTAKPVALAAGASTAAAAEPAKNLLDEAKSGEAVAQYDLAVRYTEGSAAERDYELAAQWFGKAAEQGLAVAEYRLASLYEKGLGVSQDMQRAKNLYQRAAEKGNTRAMHNLGVLAVEGSDSKPNYTSAALWFGKAAEYGIRDSQYNIAVLLARGLGLPKDLVKSYTWFAIVAAAGDADAAKKRDEVAARLTSSELAAANAAAAAFVPRPNLSAANEDSPAAAHPEAATATPEQPAKPKVSGL